MLTGASEFVHYEVPPAPNFVVPSVDLTAQYRGTLSRGLSTVGLLDPARYWRLPAMGESDIFRGAPVSARRIKASVALLWDFSGSQSQDRNQIIETLQSIGAALRRADVSVWAGAYTTIGGTCGIFEVCGWHSEWDHRRAESLRLVRMNGTPTGRALRYLRIRIMPHAPHARRAIVVCTDGGPDDRPQVLSNVERLRGQGIRVAGLYVSADADARTIKDEYGERWGMAVQDLKSLPAVFDLMLGRLWGGGN